MFKKTLFALCLCMSACVAMAQTPEVTSWKLNTSGATGYNSIPSNIQQVQYSTDNVYVSATCIPGYSIGPWPGIPGTQVPVNENFVYKITRHPAKNTGTATTINRGHIGVWSNGVSIFNPADAFSYNNQGIWNRSAIYFEGTTFDSCLGHPAPNGEYHTHVHPKCLYDDADSTHHSPIIGYAFDGFPVYGAYSYSDTAGHGSIKRMQSSYRLRSITTRDTLPNGTVATQAGPAVSPSYPLSYFLEDYKYDASYGDLDERNGRFCVTPEYPNGTYAYFVTIDNTLQPVFPYVYIGSFYGVVQAGNMDMMGSPGGHNTVTETVQTYTGDSTTGIVQITATDFTVKLSPNPASNFISIFINPIAENNFTLTMTDVSGKTVLSRSNLQPTISTVIDVTSMASGTYLLNFTNGHISHTEKVVVKR